MTVNRTTLLDLPLPVTGTESGTWGDTTNNGLTQYLDIAIAGTLVLSTDADVTLTSTEGDSSATNIGATTAQYAILRWTATGSTTRNITALAQSKTYVVINATGGTQSIVLRGAGPTTGVTIISGEKAHCVWNGSDFVKVSSSAAAGGSNTQVQYNSSGVLAGSSNMTFDGTSLTLGGNPTLSAGTANGVLYLNGSKVATSGSALTFNGTTLAVTGTANSVDINPTTGNPNIPLREGNVFRGYIEANSGGLLFGVGASATEGMRLTSTGLGIGTSSPAYKLDVLGTSRIYQSGNTAASLMLNANQGTISTGYAFTLAQSNSAGNYNFTISEGATTYLTLTNSISGAGGNLGLGVTPSAWGGISGAALEIGANTAAFLLGSGSQLFLGNNAYYTLSGWLYKRTAGASYALQVNGQHQWFTAPSGTAGNAITFTQAMTLDSSGNLGIGTSSPSYKLDVSGYIRGLVNTSSVGNASSMQLTQNGTGDAAVSFLIGSTTEWLLGVDNSASDAFKISNITGGSDFTSTGIVLDTSGNLGLGVTPSAWNSGVFKALQINAQGALMATSASMQMGNNIYYDGAYKFIGTGYANRYYQATGQHVWTVSTASGTAGGAVTETQAMTLDASGNLGVGTTSPSNRIHAFNTTTTQLQVQMSGQADMRVIADTGYGALSLESSMPLLFRTNATERARITSGGDLLVGTTSAVTGTPRATIVAPASAAGLVVQNQTFSNDNIVSWNTATANDNTFIGFYTEATITSRGSVTYNRAGGLVAYNTTSDYRAKDIIGPVTNSGEVIDSLKVYEGKMKGATQSRPMLIAHEAQAHAPYAVTGEKDAFNEDGTPKFQQIDVSSLVPLLLAEIQSLRQRVALLEGN